jgi:hypothetical protein
MQSALRLLSDIRWSILGFVLAAIGAFLSMGLNGLALYWLASPVLNLFFPPLDDWDQAVVWPFIIMVGLLWSPFFLLAGIATRSLNKRGTTPARRRAAYVLVLWLGAVAVNAILLLLNPTLWS